MKDENDKHTRDLLSGDQIRKTAAERQARMIAERAKRGWKRKTIWVHEGSLKAGEKAGKSGEPLESANESEHLVSWVMGWEKSKKS